MVHSATRGVHLEIHATLHGWQLSALLVLIYEFSSALEMRKATENWDWNEVGIVNGLVGFYG